MSGMIYNEGENELFNGYIPPSISWSVVFSRQRQEEYLAESRKRLHTQYKKRLDELYALEEERGALSNEATAEAVDLQEWIAHYEGVPL